MVVMVLWAELSHVVVDIADGKLGFDFPAPIDSYSKNAVVPVASCVRV